MKTKIGFLLCIVFVHCFSPSSGQAGLDGVFFSRDLLKNQIDHKILEDSFRWKLDRYMGNVSVSQTKTKQGSLYVFGKFQFRNFFGVIRSRDFVARFESTGVGYQIETCCWRTKLGEWCAK